MQYLHRVVSAVYYSTQDVPYGFPRDKWVGGITSLLLSLTNTPIGAINQWVDSNFRNGNTSWVVDAWLRSNISFLKSTVSGARWLDNMKQPNSPATNGTDNHPWATGVYVTSAADIYVLRQGKRHFLANAADTAFLTAQIDITGSRIIRGLRGDKAHCQITAENAYLWDTTMAQRITNNDIWERLVGLKKLLL